MAHVLISFPFGTGRGLSFGASHQRGYPVTALSPVRPPYHLATFRIMMSKDGEADHIVPRLRKGFNELAAPIPA